ncbi:MAG: NAD-dependent epimerase/dehydratase family protein [Candidatus Marinimicrobia bacterium]|nr:NAD-dependent epimerase/dehydratase family protein [Candidatus Neomarinimicrobiota bacterium]
MSTILITGSSGYLGTELCRKLESDDAVTAIIGVDLARPAEAFSKLTFYERDCTGDMRDIFEAHAIDTVVHMVFVLDMLHDKRRMRHINVDSMENVLGHCHAAGVGRIFVTSSSTAYGAHKDNPVPLKEEHPLRGNKAYQYSFDKNLVEALLATYQAEHPDCDVIIARAAIVLGPNVDNFLGRYLTKPIVPWLIRGQKMQFVHEADAREALYVLATEAGRGVYNVGPPDSVDPAAVARENGGRLLRLPAWLLRPVTQIAWWLRLRFLTEAPGGMILFIQHSWVVDGSKLERETSFRYRHTSRQALQTVFDRKKEAAV